MRYIQGYVINRIRAVVRPFIRTSVLRGKGNLNVGQNAQTSFSTESSEHFMKERVHDKICTSFVYCGFFFHINLRHLLSTATFSSKQKHVYMYGLLSLNLLTATTSSISLGWNQEDSSSSKLQKYNYIQWGS